MDDLSKLFTFCAFNTQNLKFKEIIDIYFHDSKVMHTSQIIGGSKFKIMYPLKKLLENITLTSPKI